VFLATKVDFPPNTVQEVVDYARARPGQINHNTAGILAYSHIDFLMLQKRTGIKLVAVPLRAGAGGGQLDLINGAVHIALQNAATVTPLVKAGKLKGLAVTSEKRMAVLPDVPTMKEAGFDGIGTNAWQALFGPKNMPKDVLDVITKAVHEVLTSDKAVKQLEELQFTLTPTRAAEEALAWHQQEQAHWTPIVAEARAMVEKTQ
jgi:tripartite-type tricarboxylate transporter receptor subunit TctC